MSVIALDFGTTNTVLSVWNSSLGTAETVSLDGLSVKIADGIYVVPSVLYVQCGAPLSYYVGREVAERGGGTSSGRYFHNFKRKFAEPATSVEVYPALVDGAAFPSRRVCELFLTRIFEKLRKNYVDVEQLVATVPISSYEKFREWYRLFLEEHFPEARIRLVDESTAAAIGYGATTAESYIALVDIGGGTTDVSVVKIPEFSSTDDHAYVVAKDGAYLGGADVDGWLLQFVADKLSIADTVLRENNQSLLKEAERVKIALSDKTEERFSFFDVDELRTYELVVTRWELENILSNKSFYIRLGRTMRNCVSSADRERGIAAGNIERVVAVGGTCNVPSVMQRIREAFPNNEVCSDRPYDAVAAGALNYVMGFNLVDHILRSYAIYGVRANGESYFRPLFLAKTAYPSETVTIAMSPSVHDQQRIEIKVAELRSLSVDEVLFTHNGLQVGFEHVDEYQIMNEHSPAVIRLDPPGARGVTRLKASFFIDENKTLKVTVYDILKKSCVLRDYTLVKVE